MELRIFDDVTRRCVSMVFVDVRNGRDYFAKPVELEFYEPEKFSMIEPTLRIDSWRGQALLKSMAEELERYNIKPESQHKLEGVLEATKFHLEDMRKIAKVVK